MHTRYLYSLFCCFDNIDYTLNKIITIHFVPETTYIYLVWKLSLLNSDYILKLWACCVHYKTCNYSSLGKSPLFAKPVIIWYSGENVGHLKHTLQCEFCIKCFFQFKVLDNNLELWIITTFLIYIQSYYVHDACIEAVTTYWIIFSVFQTLVICVMSRKVHTLHVFCLKTKIPTAMNNFREWEYLLRPASTPSHNINISKCIYIGNCYSIVAERCCFQWC